MAKLIAGTIVLLLVASVTPAHAQSQPFQGLFGVPAGAARPESLDLTASMFGVNDTNLPRLGRDLTQGDRTPNVLASEHTRDMPDVRVHTSVIRISRVGNFADGR